LRALRLDDDEVAAEALACLDFLVIEEHLAGDGVKLAVPYPAAIAEPIINSMTLIERHPFDVRVALGSRSGNVRVALEDVRAVIVPDDVTAIAEGDTLAPGARTARKAGRHHLITESHQVAQRRSSARHSSAKAQFS
jgi:hypothetical protein